MKKITRSLFRSESKSSPLGGIYELADQGIAEELQKIIDSFEYREERENFVNRRDSNGRTAIEYAAAYVWSRFGGCTGDRSSEIPDNDDVVIDRIIRSLLQRSV
jgi:hypothetical protein